MKSFRYVYIFAFVLLLSWSCREDFEYTPKSGTLSFSRDTVFLDTIFTNLGSATFGLKVYNTSTEDILIPNISLKNGESSNYRLNVDGQDGKSFTDVPLRGKDSLFVYIETTVANLEPSQKQLLYTDEIMFGSNGNFQKVALVTLIKNAIFLYPPSDNPTQEISISTITGTVTLPGFYLNDEELNFTNNLPYVIYGYAAVPANKTLTINAGARVFFHENSGIILDNGASLIINGELSEDSTALEKEIIFQGDKLGESNEAIPGQWDALWIPENAGSVTINYLTLKNATTGIRIEGRGNNNTSKAILNNSQIVNSANTNLLAIDTGITCTNTIFGAAGNNSIGIYGGNYLFNHCTIANYYNGGFRTNPALFISNFIKTDLGANRLYGLDNLILTNSIIDGSLDVEIAFDRDTSADFNYKLDHCSLKYNESIDNPLYNVNNTDSYEAITLNPAIDYLNAFLFKYYPTTASENVLNVSTTNSNTVPTDLFGKDRTMNTNLGATQFVPITN